MNHGLGKVSSLDAEMERRVFSPSSDAMGGPVATLIPECQPVTLAMTRAVVLIQFWHCAVTPS